MTMTTLSLPDLDIVRAVPTTVRTARADDVEDQAGTGLPRTMVVEFSRFAVWYEIDSWWEGRFLEQTAKGAFRKTIKENRSNIKVLYDHGFDFSVGNKVLGTIDDLREDEQSPVGEVGLFDTSYNRDLLPGLDAGVYGSSFRFRVVKEKWNKEPGVSAYNPEGLPERTITEVKLSEFGPVTWPANPDSTASLRCMSLTDTYYERLRGRDPNRVDELRSRLASIRTPDAPAAAQQGTGDAGAAPETTDEPATRHSGGLAAAERRARLYPFLMEGASS